MKSPNYHTMASFCDMIGGQTRKEEWNQKRECAVDTSRILYSRPYFVNPSLKISSIQYLNTVFSKN